ncbi:MAG TPA: tetratricopeptide repeat protein [Waterburya sp.]|jgi:tetratricopeptide (TPR) repeat protein
MTNQLIYISRQQAETFLAEFAKALNQPGSQPLLFQVHGIGGVGKSTLLRKLRETYQQQVDFAEVSFGITEGIETPLELMEKLYEELPKPSLPPLLMRDVGKLRLPPDPFTSLAEQYQQTRLALQTQTVSGKQLVDGEQQSAVKDLLDLGVLTLFSVTGIASVDTAVAGLGKAVGMLKDAPQAIACGKERVQQLLQQHPATKGKKELQELMLEPLPKLTQAFAQGLIQKAQKRPIVIVLDTYEKAPPALDLWLCKYLLGNTKLKSNNVRIVVAGRHNLLKTEYWRKLQQDRELVYAQSLERFDREQTADYLQQIGITEPDEVEDVYQTTKGLPKYLYWVRQEKEAGRERDFSQGNQEIVNLLLQGLNSTQKQVLQIVACCRWFDKGLIRHLMNAQNLNFDTAADDRLNCFEWLTQRDFAEFAQHRYRLDDVARDVFRLSLWQEDEEQFCQIHGLLADYFKERAEREVPPDSPPPAQYNNPDWCSYIAEFLYHSLFSRRGDTERQVISHLFASCYFHQEEVVRLPLMAIIAEADLADHRLLNYAAREFLTNIEPAIWYSGFVLDADPSVYKNFLEQFLNDTNLSKSQLEATLQICFSHISSLDGLAKFAALLYKSKRCLESQRLGWLQQAKGQAELICTPTAPEFNSDLWWNVGNELLDLGQFEEALASYNKAIEIKPDFYEAWISRGFVLANLGHYQDALTASNTAVKIKPDYPEGWYNQGVISGLLGSYEEALTSFKQLIAIEPNYYKAWERQGLALWSLRRDEEAIASYKKALEIKPDHYRTWELLGQALIELGRYEEALTSYEKATELKPDFVENWQRRGMILQFLGRYEEAIASFDSILGIEPNNYDAWFQRGYTLTQLKRNEEAIISFDKALEIEPDDHTAWNNRGNALHELSRYEEALANYNKALDLNSDFYESWCNRGNTLTNLSLYKEAITSYDKALELKPNLYEAWNSRGVVLNTLGRYEEAIASFDEACKIEPNSSEAWTQRGNALLSLDRYEEAILSYDRAINTGFNLYGSLNNKGSSLYKLGHYEEALACVERALELKADCREAWYNKGNILLKLGHEEEAITSYDRVLALEPDREYWVLSSLGRGDALFRLGRYKEAVSSYDKALTAEANHQRTWRVRGVALLSLGCFEEAIISFDHAIEIKPDYLEWLLRGHALYNLGHYEEAITSYNEAIEIQSGYADAYYGKACCYALQGKVEETIEHLQQVVSLNPNEGREIIKTQSAFESIRTNSTFQALIRGDDN